ncbi:MAG: penicillin-binding protein 1A [Myxococcota bacterium]|jgi:penicillin-binding protein 1A
MSDHSRQDFANRRPSRASRRPARSGVRSSSSGGARNERSQRSSGGRSQSLGGGRPPGKPRKKKASSGTRSKRRFLLKWGLIGSLLGGVLAIIGYWGLVFYFEHRLPDVFETDDYIARTAQVSRIYSRNGDVLSELGHERRSVAAPESIPKLVKLAVLAAEDADFYQHDGLDYFGMARAMYKNVRDQRFSQGASTITQQVAKTFFLSAERTIARKLKEVVLARRLEHELTKDEILYLYLNQIYWGHGRYGVKEAARFYFGKDLKDVSLADAALLAGMIAAPERFSPFKDQRKAQLRRAFVLDQMAKHGFVDSEKTEKAKREPIRLNFRGDPHVGLGGYVGDMVRGWLVNRFGSERVRRGGLHVYTSVDTRLQREAEEAVRAGLVGVDRAWSLAKARDHVSKRRLPGLIEDYRRQRAQKGVRSGAVVRGVVIGIDKAAGHYLVELGLGPCRLPFGTVERYRGRLEAHELYRVGDVLRLSPALDLHGPSPAGVPGPIVNLDQGPQGALVSIDPGTRQIRALVGGYDHATHPYNRARSARRQAGSTFKPIVLAAALESGIVKPLDELRNVPESYKMGNGRYWKPRNFDNTYDGRLYTARMALAKSINTIAVKTLEKTGLRRVSDFARRIGIETELDQNLSIALGSAGVSPLELANSYSTFAAGGYLQAPVLVTRVEDFDGTVLYEAPTERKRGTTSKVAFRITEMLQAVIEHGTGKGVRHLGRPAAGKTGTTDGGVDTWFAGYTPQLVTTVWVGFDDRTPLKKATGGKVAAPIWARFMTAAHEGLPIADFQPPNGLEPLPPVNKMVALRTPSVTGEDGEDDGSDQDGGGVVDLLYE